mmetsp:Transcript_6184/g.8027  ORF Transcript_6184/g.8027 Transcript_6184/m.8027 type:complete len:485 (+) Transcript_6184:106-1560(+)|eukprot:CAMPEP_0198145768 /NCGR_PEP_ID=MMETSP1443-20131203/25272_1 /TAXON_ID=186043 /ORGANISM="Entomoneis sp., Strain CCMP2396" /LENGTH=484 /DNA_ID=CAMNT_0043809493 /DNA_START=90 /DNA_END=1544 /DNA_ORIENTATION=-
MPKAKKIRANALDGKVVHHDPLGQVIVEDNDRNKFAKQKNLRSRQNDDDKAGDEGAGVLDSKDSRRILELGKEQQLELQAEEVLERRTQRPDSNAASYKLDSDEEEDDDKDEMFDEIENDDDGFNLRIERDGEGYVDIAEMPGLSAEDEALVASMMGGGQDAEPRQSLADLILEKIQEKEAEKRGEMGPSAEDEDAMINLPPKVVEVYTDIGKILSRYTSGKLPKAFKVIPSLSNWEEVLYLTRPDTWSPTAMYQATRIFASNLNPKMAQRFYNLVLLDAVRADIVNNKKLNYHYYMALKKSVYKPAAFFKGILLPLCKAPDCTLREAAIVASVLQRVSIPVHHSAVAIHKLATLDGSHISAHYGGATSIFLKTLLNKKYSLPAPVIASLVKYYVGFCGSNLELPVLWHQSFLVFVQRYKHELQKSSVKEGLKNVLKRHFHPKITPEIRRELFGAAAYQQERQAAGYSLAGGTMATASSSAMET